jgi:phosphopantothenoylcysteine decarboxylase/phosphopantothenate--cysteine ligase
MKILLVVSGGIAAYKTPKIVSLLKEQGHEVRVVATSSALRFVSQLTLATLSGNRVLHDLWEGPGDRELSHIRLPEWADFILVAPATANLLGKVANGVADDLASTLLNAVGTGENAACPVVYLPAMNTRMWEHAATQANVEKLISWGAKVIFPESGRLACEDQGTGRMPEPEDCIARLQEWGLLKSEIAG